MTPNAYMTDEAWEEATEILAKGLRNLPVVCDYPDWWFILTLDGYGSHLNVYKTLKIFSDYKIMLVKEEGDTSHVNQAYDQSVAKADKRHVREWLEKIRHKIGIFNQWTLISTCLVALKSVLPSTWEDSFKKVNLHPDYRVPFDEWLKRIDDQLETGERFFVEREASMFDAMPCGKPFLESYVTSLLLLLTCSILQPILLRQFGQRITYCNL